MIAIIAPQLLISLEHAVDAGRFAPLAALAMFPVIEGRRRPWF